MSKLLKEKQFLIHLDNCDHNDNMKMSGMFNYFQDMAAMHAFEINAGYEDMVNKGYYWVILYERIDMKRIPKMYEDVTIKTWPKKRQKLEFEREFEMFDSNNELIATGISTWVVIDIEKRMISRAKDVDFEGEYVTDTLYQDKPKKRLGLTLGEVLKEFDYCVTINDIDHNGHMNNAKYLDIINLMQIDNSFTYKKVEAAFIKEVMLGEIVNVKYFKQDSNDCFIGYVNDNVAFEVMVEGEGK